MSSRVSSALPHVSRRPLASSIAAFLAVILPATGYAASTWTVDNTCGDDVTAGSGQSGTLRYCVKNAVSGDTVDLSKTTCSQITLQAGAISMDQTQLTIQGAGKNQPTISGKNGTPASYDRIFAATVPGGDIKISHLTVAYGKFASSTGPANGGCIYSKGSLELDNVGAYYCTTTTTATSNSKALGGAVYAHALTIKNSSTLAHNGAYATQPAIAAEGGGAASAGAFYLSDSVVSLNTVMAAAGNNPAFGGGLELNGSARITRSLIVGNQSSLDAGGIDLFSNTVPPEAVITNSTITMNSAGRRTGGLETNFRSTWIANSTIAFNTATHYAYVAPLRFYSPGVAVNYQFSVGSPTLNLESTIIANNTSGGFPNDLSAGAKASAVTIAGANNLARTFGPDITLPPGQGNISGVCPQLGPLQDNGGGSFTYALKSGPGVGVGDNTVLDPFTHATALYDQRGPGYLRSVNGLTDMGAYERQEDLLFDASFEGCP